jgi:putative flippase GtrA
VPVPAVLRRLDSTWRLLLKELSGFGVVGAIAFVVDLSTFQLLYTEVGASPVTAKVCSTVISMTVAYVGHRYWSFSHRMRTGLRREYLLFALINVTTLLLSVGIVAYVHHGLGQTSALVLQVANVASIAVGTAIRFTAYRRWVFPAAPAAPSVPTPAPLFPL